MNIFPKNTFTQQGTPYPLGVHKKNNGLNFAIFSSNATQVFLEFFEHQEDKKPYQTFTLNPKINKTQDIWHIWVQNVPSGQIYSYRIVGPNDPSQGFRFDSKKYLIDPYAKVLTSISKNSEHPKSVYIEEDFDWENDQFPNHLWENTIIYETHVRGLTKSSSSKVKYPGTYKGVIEKIPYFKELGITAIEFLPIFEFNHLHSGVVHSKTKEKMPNYWGYDTISFFAPKSSYSSTEKIGSQIVEFKEMVRELHKENIEIILDVVFNHTAEGNENGPTISFRGIDNPVYYHLEKDKRYYKNFSGTGNTLNANHPVVIDFILDALRYWVSVMHVDGFRFDLASLLNLNENGFLLTNAPLLKKISADSVLKNTKLIAEAWGPNGIYQVGNFATSRWSEWNDQFRDDMRSFWRGNNHSLRKFANRLSGSKDIYSLSGKTPANSINFLTCHDGFTLNDLVSYKFKHNNSNGQNNEDGSNQNKSDNYGHEGESDDPSINNIRIRQIKNFLLCLFISRGVPMILGGDEFGRSQQGNNNAFCQDNEISWYNWDLLKQNCEIFEFTKRLIQFRKDHPVLSKSQFYSENEILWFDPFGESINLENIDEKKCACLIEENNTSRLFFMFNPCEAGFDFTLPSQLHKFGWKVQFDTFFNPQTLHSIHNNRYYVENRTSVILISE